MLRVSQTSLVRFILAILFVGIALLVTSEVAALATRSPYALFFAAVLAVTWFSGRSLGIGALILSAVVSNYFVISPANAFKLDAVVLSQLGTFVSVAALIVWLTSILRQRNSTILESATRLGFLFESNPFPMWIIDPESLRFLAVNDAATHHYGYSRDEFLDMTAYHLRPEELNVKITDDTENESNAPTHTNVWKHRKKDGSEIFVELVFHNLIYNGIPAQLTHVVDVTESVRKEAALQASEAQMLKIFGKCPVALVINRWSDRKFVEVNPEFSRLTGWERDEVIGRTVIECGLVEEEAAVRIREYLNKFGSMIDREVEIKNRRGEQRTVIMCSVFIEMLGEQHAITTFVDITERRLANQERLASEERLRIVTDNARVGLVMINSDRRYTFANAAYADLLDLPTANIIGHRVMDVHALLYREQIGPHLDRAFAGERVEFELYQPTPGGGDRFYSVKYEPTRVDDSVPIVVVVITDITDSYHAELAIQASEERYQTLFEYSPDGIAIANSESYYVDANETLCQLLGYTRDQLIGLHATNIVVPKEITHLGETLGGLNTDLEYYQEWQFRRKDGSTFHGEVIANRMPDGNTLTVIRDITERKHLEDQLIQAQKMEAIGVLAGGVAHDFNNILTAISGYSDLTLENMPIDDPLRNYIVEIKDAGNRAAALTGQLLAFSRRRVLAPTVHNLNLAVTDTERMLRRIVKENIEFRIDLDPVLGSIKADPGQIAQVIVNLAVNAGDAMPNGGTLTIGTRNVLLDEEFQSERVAITPGPYVELTVADTGTGMDDQTQRRLFEPFYTTKEIGKGTGLGLSTVYGIVKQSGGDITVHSELGRGTTFKIYFPIVEYAFESLTSIKKNYSDGQGSETILLVEDEVAVRTLVNNILTRQGYDVIEVDSGAAAITICKSIPNKIQMLLTDMIMPKMDGGELRDEVLKIRPDVKILFMSGYTGDAVGNDGVLNSGSAFIEKPFTPNELVRKIREVLGTEICSPHSSDNLSSVNEIAKAAHSR